MNLPLNIFFQHGPAQYLQLVSLVWVHYVEYLQQHFTKNRSFHI